MSSIIYYSNFCEPSKKLLQVLAKSRLKEEFHFICIDTRYVKDNKTMIEINGQHILLPPVVTKVPSLYLMKTNQVITGDDIYKQIAPVETVINKTETSGMGEPECFNPNMLHMSDIYSFLDQDPEELETKGGGGMRQIHSFVGIDQNFNIQTPPDDYEPDKVKGTQVFEEYKKEREISISSIKK